MVDGFQKFLMGFGGTDVAPGTSIKGARMIEIMGTFDVMFSSGKYFAGVHEVPTIKQAEKLAQILADSLQKI